MKSNLQLAFLFVLLLQTYAQTQECNDPTYIIPTAELDDIFGSGLYSIRSQQNLVTLIEQPNDENVRNYLLSLAPFAAPLFVMAAITFVLFVAMVVQVICFNTCGKQCCGNELTPTTYNVCCMRTMTMCFVFLSFVLMGLSIAALIVNSDLQYTVDNVSCNTQNIVFEAYNGNTNETIPWSGLSNFGDDINIFAVNIQNVVPNLATYFSSSNSAYSSVIDISTTTTAYNLSQTYNCQNASGFVITCPFDNSTQCPSPYEAEFTLNFCDSNVEGSAENLIQNEMSVNSTNWRTNIIGIGQTLSSVQINQQNIDTLTNDINQFTNSTVEYEQTLEDGFSEAESINYNVQIGLYVLFSFLLTCGIFGIATVCCTYYCNNYKCNCFTYVWCFLYFILGLLMFVAAGLFLSGSIFTYDTCSAYPYYFQNQTQFKSLTFSNSQIGEIFQTCFFEGSTSIFTAFEDSTVLTDFTTLKEEYSLAVPASTFYSVVTTIQDKLSNYKLNPQTIEIANVSTDQQPEAALADANKFANYSETGSTQTCNVTKDELVFNVADCYPYLVGQNVGENSCVVLSASENITGVIAGRTTAFSNNNCSDQGSTYEANADALYDYRLSINDIIDDLYSQGNDPANPLQAYEDNYYSYYTDVENFFGDSVTDLFDSFFEPYDRLYDGSSCGFVTASMDGIINQSCNQLFPYFNTLTIISIIISVVVFILMILSYFLTTRYQFYEYLDGDLENWGQEKKKSEAPGYEMDSTRNYNQEFISNRNY